MPPRAAEELHPLSRDPLVVVFTDLDDPLQDRDEYSRLVMEAASQRLREAGIPLVLCSGRTRAEIEVTRRDLEIDHPFISESGGAVFVPRGYFRSRPGLGRPTTGYDVLEFGRPYDEVTDVLYGTAARLRIDVIGFREMSVEEVAHDCRLPLLHASLAKLREYDEPFRLRDTDPATRNRLFRALSSAGFHCSTGQRYSHATGVPDPVAGVRLLRALYAEAAAGAVVTVGLGSRLEDVALLHEVDVPIIVHSDSAGSAPHLLGKVPTARVVSGAGSSGWAEVMEEVADLARLPARCRKC